ncbi:MAG: InlB B-repeat-containing protein [Treponema sp.]|nr:InlB B-repeat-containing protein [Treponema sp.]
MKQLKKTFLLLVSIFFTLSLFSCKTEEETNNLLALALMNANTTKQYTVTFNANDGSANPATATQVFTAGSAQALKTAATLGFSKTNYAFAGWATSKEASSAAYADGASYTATADVTLYAVWTAITYTVTFNANDGSANPSTATQVFTAGTAQALKTAATLNFSRTNYAFAGWATSKEASSAAYADGALYTATADITLYAVWKTIDYTVTFNANDGSASPATATQAFTAGTAQALKTAAALGFTKTNYAFAGWATSSDATSAAYADGASFTATGNVTLYAVWKTIDYTVTFNANDGSANPATATQAFTAGTAQALKTAAALGFSKTNYAFAGWATSKEASSAAYADGASYTATENVTLYAVWKTIDYTVTFNANDGSASPATATQAFTAGTAQVLKTAATLGFSRANYTFAGWATTNDATSATLADGASYTATGNVTLYAVWTAITYTVTFNANDGSANPSTATQVFTAGSAQALKTAAALVFSKTNYTFAGWATCSDATSAAYEDGASYTAAADITLYAVWTAITYTVTFNANDGSANPATATQVFTAGTAQALKKAATLGFSRANYTFAGWATTNNAASATLADEASYTATGNVTLYAVWTLITYTVTFNANDGSANPATATQVFTAGTAQALKTAATLGFSKSGYTFAGWATTNDATSVAYADEASYTATADVTLYAVWRLKVLSGISVTTAPSKVLYFAGSGEILSTDGMVVTATYDNGSTATVTRVTSSDFDSTSGGIKALTVSYTEDGITKTTTTPYYVAASDALTQTVQDNGSTTIDSNTFQLVKFGDFPQTIAESGITYSSSTVYNGWYLGSDGYFYEKVHENGYYTTYRYSNNVRVAKINNTSPNYLYFKVEPIEWRVLKIDSEARTKLLLAEKILTANVPYYGATSERTLNGTTIYANNYKYSNIRAYLNGTKNQFVLDGGTSNDYTINWETNGFLKKAFTTSAQNLIPATAVDNSARSTNPEANASQWNNGANTYACDNTSDKIFLLSEQEVTTSAYGFAAFRSSGAGNSRIRVTTDYAKANYAYQYNTSGYGGDWWFRSPYYNGSNCARYVSDDGYPSNYHAVNDSGKGVCPALSISF